MLLERNDYLQKKIIRLVVDFLLVVDYRRLLNIIFKMLKVIEFYII